MHTRAADCLPWRSHHSPVGDSSWPPASPPSLSSHFRIVAAKESSRLRYGFHNHTASLLPVPLGRVLANFIALVRSLVSHKTFHSLHRITSYFIITSYIFFIWFYIKNMKHSFAPLFTVFHQSSLSTVHRIEKYSTSIPYILFTISYIFFQIKIWNICAWLAKFHSCSIRQLVTKTLFTVYKELNHISFLHHSVFLYDFTIRIWNICSHHFLQFFVLRAQKTLWPRF